MTERDLAARIRQGVFVLDGAMGTQLIARGVEAGRCNDWLNVERPDLVLDVHKAYLDAGSDAILTNTFGANRYALGRHGCADKAFEINKAAAQVARKAAGESRYVLGDVGPTGDFLEPLGLLKPDQVREAFVEQVKGLVAVEIRLLQPLWVALVPEQRVPPDLHVVCLGKVHQLFRRSKVVSFRARRE